MKINWFSRRKKKRIAKNPTFLLARKLKPQDINVNIDELKKAFSDDQVRAEVRIIIQYFRQHPQYSWVDWFLPNKKIPRSPGLNKLRKLGLVAGSGKEPNVYFRLTDAFFEPLLTYGKLKVV